METKTFFDQKFVKYFVPSLSWSETQTNQGIWDVVISPWKFDGYSSIKYVEKEIKAMADYNRTSRGKATSMFEWGGN